MSRRLKYLLPIISVTALIAFFAKALIGIDSGGYDPRLIQSPLLNKPAPAFVASALLEPTRSVALDAYKGKFVLVNVWGSWCVACRQEHESLLKIHASHSIEILGVDWRDEPTAAQQYLQRLGNPYSDIASDPTGRIAIDFGVTGAPESFLIDPEGRIVAKHTGPLTPEAFQQEIAPWLHAGGAP
jgi:cytochrome c biogenesis protein CcmG, thiol:disulfide interchange protein DsbE